MITEERIDEIATDILGHTQWLFEKRTRRDFARAIEREAYMQGQEDMRERADEVCDRANKLGETVWNAQQKIRNLEIEEPK